MILTRCHSVLVLSEQRCEMLSQSLVREPVAQESEDHQVLSRAYTWITEAQSLPR